MSDLRTELLRRPGLTTTDGVSSSQLAAAEEQLDVLLPPALRQIYQASDGVFDEPGQWYVIWSVDRLVSDNLDAWRRPGGIPRSLIGFGDDGAGSWFCMRPDGTPGIFLWNFIDGDHRQLAESFAEFMHGWISGTITT